MKKALACVTLVLSACSEKYPDDPVDMQFRAAIEQLENSCGDGDEKAPEGYTAIVDVFLRSNGNIDITSNSYYVPGRPKYEDIALKDGRIDHTLKVQTSDGVTLDHHLKGVVRQGSIDLEMTVHDRNWSDNGKDCVRKVQLKGSARPLSDPAALDGTYKVAIGDYGFGCPGDPARQKSGDSVAILEIDHYLPDKAAFYLGQLGWNALPDENGAVDTSFSAFLGGFFEVEGTVTGTVAPPDVDLAVDYGLFGDPSGCTFLFTATGSKRIPTASALDNEYRVAFDMNDGCEIGLESAEASAQIVTQADGKLVLVDPYLGGVEATLTAEGALAYTVGSEDQGEVLTVSGSASPPHLDYTVEYKAETSPGTWCSVTYSATGHVRYVFE